MQRLSTLDRVILTTLIELTALLVLPFLFIKTWPLSAPQAFVAVLIFCFVFIFWQQLEQPPLAAQIGLIILLLAIIGLLFWQQNIAVAILLTLQFILKLALHQFNNQQEKIATPVRSFFKQALIPFFLTIALLATMIDLVSITDMLVIAGLYLIKWSTSLRLARFADFIWPFLGLLLSILMWQQQLLTTASVIIIAIGLLISLLFYPKRRNWLSYPAFWFLFLSLATRLPVLI